uniref:Uncharacterized protein n=1 Tax=Glycine max TaxID=3847 RepID=C6T3U2_SOYBN|nr:unknown [Glycine max]
MAMRDLVSGAAACGDSSSSSSNPLASLANALIGSSSKTQERLKEIPTSTPTDPASQFYSTALPANQLPGSEFDKPLLNLNSQASEFLHRFSGSTGLEETWDEIQRDGAAAQMRQLPPGIQQPPLDGTPQRVLSNILHSFLDSSRGGVPFSSCSTSDVGFI